MCVDRAQTVHESIHAQTLSRTRSADPQAQHTDTQADDCEKAGGKRVSGGVAPESHRYVYITSSITRTYFRNGFPSELCEDYGVWVDWYM